ncbi:MAG: cupin domain-containing protein [Candidatus Natronoplasma sp.]
MEKINLDEKFQKIEEYFSPKIIGEFNDQSIKISKVKGEFIEHKHDDTDEVFLVIKGSLTIELENGSVNLNENEIFIVPKGTKHKPISEEETHVVVIEPKDTVNTGDIESDLTEKNLDSI